MGLAPSLRVLPWHFTINFTHFICTACHILSTCTTQRHSPFAQLATFYLPVPLSVTVSICTACHILSTCTTQRHCLHLHSLSHSIYLYHSASLSPFAQSVPSSFSHSLLSSHPLHCHFTTYHHQSHPLHWIYIQHFLKPFTDDTSGKMLCHAVMIYTD